MHVLEARRTVIKITEIHEECIYSTKEVGEIWIPLQLSREERSALARNHDGDFLGSISTKDQAPAFRSRKIET